VTTEFNSNNAAHSGKNKVSVLHWRRLAGWSLKLVLMLLVLVTAGLTMGRLLMPMLPQQRAFIESELADLLGAEVRLGDLRGEWFRLGPIIEIDNLEIINSTNPQLSQQISNISIKPSILDSLLSKSLVIEQIVIQDPSLELVESEPGVWGLAGVSSSGENNMDAKVDFLLNIDRLQIAEATLGLQFADGRQVALSNIFIDFSNAGDFHLVQLQARLSNQPSPFQLQLDIVGDPMGAFNGRGHFRAKDLDFSKLVNVAELKILDTFLSGDLWATFNRGALSSLQASIESLAFNAEGIEGSALDQIALTNTSAELAVVQDGQGHWKAWLNNLEFDWRNRPWNADGLFLDYAGGDQQSITVNAASLDLAMAMDLADDLIELPERVVEAFADLSPTGFLTNLSFQTKLDGQFENGFLLEANLQDASVGAWQGVPAASGIQGYVWANQVGGFVELDSSDFDIHLPRLFTQSWHYDSINSRVHWTYDDRVLRVNSSIIDVRNDWIHGHIQFDLYNHPDSTDEIQSELTLLIGVLEMDASYKSALLPNMERIQNTMDWLDAGLLAGNVTNSGFVSRTSTRRNVPPNSGTVMSFYHIEDGELKFQPQWQELTGIKAFVNVDNNDIDVIAESAEIENIALGTTVASVRSGPESGSWLSIKGDASATTSEGLAFLRNTPVRNGIGDFIDDWRGEGSVEVDIELGIPLNNPQLQTQVHVNVLSDRSTLTIPEYALSISELRGRVAFDSDIGLTANALSGRLFDFPIAATIEPLRLLDDGEIIGTRIVGSGRASKPALQAWEGQPQFVRDVLNFASGEIDYLAEISIPYAELARETMMGTSLRVTSELLGLSLDLPYPFRKTVEQIRQMALRLDFSEDSEWVLVRFDNSVSASLLVSNAEFQGGNVILGPDAGLMEFGESIIERPGLSLSGSINHFDYEEWEQTAVKFTEMSGAKSSDIKLADFLSYADVRVGSLVVFEQELEKIQTILSRTSVEEDGAEVTEDSWLVQLENEMISGDFIFPDAETTPWRVSLDYLRFPQDEEELEGEEAKEEDIDILENVIPGELPDLVFSTEEFFIGDKNLGAWEFNLRSNGDAASISDLRMTTPDAQITDNSEEAGANLNWRYSNGMHTSSFTGLFSAGDLAKVLPAWGYDANVESQNAAFTSNLQWSGSPAAFDLDKVIGNVRVAIRNGRFVDVDSGSSRLFGAFSLDSLVRRLQLDFSDLYERGLAYDNIDGRLDFNDGIVRSNGEFVIAGPSSRITIDGELDLVNETIDANMLVNIPFSQNVSVLAGILGAWPIAVSTYIASRIFRNQMDEFTTVVYRLEGPWDNPVSGFEPSEEILEADSSQETDAETTAE